MSPSCRGVVSKTGGFRLSQLRLVGTKSGPSPTTSLGSRRPHTPSETSDFDNNLGQVRRTVTRERSPLRRVNTVSCISPNVRETQMTGGATTDPSRFVFESDDPPLQNAEGSRTKKDTSYDRSTKVLSSTQLRKSPGESQVV